MGRIKHYHGEFEDSLTIQQEILNKLNSLFLNGQGQENGQENGLNIEQGHELIYYVQIEISKIFYNLSKFNECKALIQETGKSLAVMVGTDHELVTQSLIILSQVNNQNGKYKDSQKILSRSLIMARTMHGSGNDNDNDNDNVNDNHPQIGNLLLMIGNSLRLQGYYKDALKNIESSLQILKQFYLIIEMK